MMEEIVELRKNTIYNFIIKEQEGKEDITVKDVMKNIKKTRTTILHYMGILEKEGKIIHTRTIANMKLYRVVKNY